MKQRVFQLLTLALFGSLLVSTTAWAQQDNENNSRFEFFGGYSWFHPGATVAQTPLAPGQTTHTAPSVTLKDLNKGFGVDGTYRFYRWFGLKAAYSGHWSDPSNISILTVGPVITVPVENATFFAEALGGFMHVSPSKLNSSIGGAGVFGGGMELWFTPRIAWRVAQVDYVRSDQSVSDLGGSGDFSGIRLQSGLVIGFGSLTPPPAAAATCTVTPTEVLVGETVTANVATSNFNPKHTLAYEWSGSGASSTSNAATVATKDLPPGPHTVTAKVSDPKKAKAVATCSAQFNVKPLPPKNPPTMSCAANPATVVAGGAETLNCTCTSPDGAAVKVSNWRVSSGTVSGTDNTASVDTTGVAPGNVTVGATCTDDRGLSTQATVAFAVEAPPAPKVNKQVEARLALHSVYFQTAKPTVKEPTVGLLNSQEKTLEALAADFATYREAVPDAHLVLEGHADVRGTAEYNQALTERRVAIVKNFLVAHGVPETLIETKPLGDQHNLTVEEVKASVESDPDISSADKARILKNITVIKWASNRRVDITLKAAGMSETSKRKFPFNSADALTLIAPAQTTKKAGAAHKKAAPKQ